MKIVFLIDQIYKYGGLEKVLTEKSSYFADEFNYSVTIITTEQREKKTCYPLSNNVSLIDIDVHYERTKSYFNIINVMKAIDHYKGLKKQIKEINPDFIILLSDAFDYYFLPYISNKSKILKEFHSSYYFTSIERARNKSLLKRAKFFIRDYINSKYDYLIVLNNDEKSLLNCKNTVVIPNGITINNSEYAILEEKRAISAGRIAPVKNFEALIQAWKYVENQYPDWKLEIYGEGDKQYILQLHKLIEELKLSNSICMCGSTDHLKEKMLNSSIYVMSSITECFPMVLLEAQSCGLPIVSFDCPCGPRNIITKDNDGLLIEDQNIIKLSDGIIKLIESADIRKKMGKNAKENVKRYEFTKIMERWKILFESTYK
jgi:glycosyltransferase involved in cell wall biosynthesis